MGIFDKINDVQRAAAEKSKNVSETANLKRKILYEEERIVEIFADIGKMYYKDPEHDPAEFKILCDDIDTRRRRIKKMKYELNGLKGMKMCGKCNIEVSDRFQFCPRCGGQLPESNLNFESNDFFADLD
ncbi:MAG: zinc ribbon domain-containing protein [Ruminococcus sp.]|nr:zinc ribbon domain-containing protein [Ruminococcus sp.]